MANRKIVELLPQVNQTAALTKFFNATVDHLFQPENSEFLAGYVGSHPVYYNPVTDFYVPEPTSDREKYQLTPTVVSRDPQSGAVQNILFYDDLLNKLRLQGAITSSPERLFNNRYYSWSPPVDVDLFLNWNQYRWVPQGPRRIDLLDVTDFYQNIRRQSSYTYTGSFAIANADGSSGTSQTGSIVFTTGLKIRFLADSRPEYNNHDWIVCNVGEKILLVNDDWASDATNGLRVFVDQGPKYYVQERGTENSNSYSLANRWFHLDVLNVSQTLAVENPQNSLTETLALPPQRPILQYLRNLELWNQGTTSRGYINFTSDDPNFIATYTGVANPIINDQALQDGDLILVINDNDSNVNNRIYQVSGLSTIGQCVLTAQPRSPSDSNTQAQLGDQVLLITAAGDIETWHYTGGSWQLGQTVSDGRRPLWMLYDGSGVALDDSGAYPGSTFTGSLLFSYQTSDFRSTDTYLGISVELNEFGDWIFENHQQTDTWTYLRDNIATAISGWKYSRITRDDFVSEQYANGWYQASSDSRQYLDLQYVMDQGTLLGVGEQNKVFSGLAYPNNALLMPTGVEIPSNISNNVPSVNVIRNRQGVLTQLLQNTDYNVENTSVVLVTDAQEQDRYFISVWSNNQVPTTQQGVWQTPWNLSRNPNNQDISSLSRGEYLPHLSSMIANQTGFTGESLGFNNWRDTARNPSLGTYILQHNAPMLKLGVLNSTPQTDINSITGYTDPQLVITWADKQYQTFYSRFINSLFNLSANQGYNLNQDPQTWVRDALRQVNLGKTARSPWANSGYDLTQPAGAYCSQQATTSTWIPATGTRLGLAGAYYPRVFVDTTQPNNPLVIQTHDGAEITMIDSDGLPLAVITTGAPSTSNPGLLSSGIAAAWLQFELNLYNNLLPKYSDPDNQVTYNITTRLPGKWRTSDYTRAEIIQIQRPMFERWAVANQVNVSANTSFDLNDQFSFNYRTVPDLNGQPLPGYWRGIYQLFYDTDRPDIRPWEMLGFSQQPTWWTEEYGQAPYTRGNTKLWQDLSEGLIRQGSTAGYWTEWARPGLLLCIPVGTQGELLPPLAAGVVQYLPSTQAAASEWDFGDGAPVEQAWRKSQSRTFTQAFTAYLTKPAEFVDINWDVARTETLFADSPWPQFVYTDTQTRKNSGEFLAHRENPSLLNLPASLSVYQTDTYFGSCGLQHWFSEYLVSKGQDVTNYLGNVIRGSNINLAHKFAGYVQSDTLRVLVDSFGQVNYASRIVPAENRNVYLYRSGSIGEYFYSGVVVQKVTGGYKVFGYDNNSSAFTVIPPNTAGRRQVETLGNLRVTFWQQGLNTTETVLYGTVLATPQQVVDLVTGFGRWLTTQGWVFDRVNDDNGRIVDWQYSAREFVYWCQGSWGNNNFIALSPSSNQVTLRRQQGQIQFVPGTISGVYPILNKTGTPIVERNLETLREDTEITIRPINTDTIFGARLFVNTLEHVMILDNVTQFNDIVYQPLFYQYQPRVKVYTHRTRDWTGRLDAPGYFLVPQAGNTWALTSNFDKTAKDFTRFFNIDQAKPYTVKINGTTAQQESINSQSVVTNPVLNRMAKHQFSYQQRDYLRDLLLEDATEFEFFQGYIRQKGTFNSLGAILRNTGLIPQDSTFDYFEEFALRLGQFGGVAVNNLVEFYLNPQDVNNTIQWINLFSTVDSDLPGDDVLSITPGDSRIVTPPTSYVTSRFPLRDSYQPRPATDVPTAGYVQLGETSWQVFDQTELVALWDDNLTSTRPVAVNDTVWQFSTDSGSWTAWALLDTGLTINRTLSSQTTASPTTVFVNQNLTLVDNDIIVLTGVQTVAALAGTFTVSAVDTAAQSFQIDISTFENGQGGKIYKYYPIRFTNVAQRDAFATTEPLPQGLRVFVDQGDQIPNAWTVYARIGTTWLSIRNQTLMVDSELMQSCVLFTSSYNQPSTVLQYFDPIQGQIPSLAEQELVYKRENDPAQYNKSVNDQIDLQDDQAWTDEHLGETWWDLGSVRYVDYHQGDLKYRIQHWGQLAPGAEVSVYEWIRSPVLPTDWASLAAAGQPVTLEGVTFTPSGEVYNPGAPSWCEQTIYTSVGRAQIWYYFWVKNSTMQPTAAWRRLTTQEISNVITNTGNQQIPWWAAIDDTNLLVANVRNKLAGSAKILQVAWQDASEDPTVHSQWQLFRPGDSRSVIPQQFWQRCIDSLLGFDGLGNDVPDYKLAGPQRLGTLVRPRQTWFQDPVAAGANFVTVANALIANLDDPLVTDPNKTTWRNYFFSQQPVPDSSQYDFVVPTIADRDLLIPDLYLGARVLVTATPWANYQWQGDSSWILLQLQAWDTQLYWQYVDWYAQGYVATSTISQTVPLIRDLDYIDGTTVEIVKVLNDGSGKWQWYAWLDQQWTLVAQQDGSIEILPSVYDNVLNNWCWDQAAFDSTLFDASPAPCFQQIIQGLLDVVFDVLQQNTLFTSMLNYVLSEQVFVDWLTKTRYVTLRGFGVPLSTNVLYQQDEVNSLLAYINEIKPYTAKIREFINSRTLLDSASFRVTDFDKPPYLLANGTTEILDEANAQQAAYMAKSTRYKDWLAQYQYQASRHLIRQPNIRVYFDRVSSEAYGWDYVWEDITGFSKTENGENWGAAARIRNSYQPQLQMPPLSDIKELLQAQYKGEILDSLPLNWGEGWNSTPWNHYTGWDSNSDSIYDYLDVIISGGEIPEYDIFTPDTGGSSSFNLSYIPQSPSQTVVWIDSAIGVYGQDWIIPNWITQARPVDPGVGYAVGNRLLVTGGTNLVPAELEVATVNGTGGILTLTVVDPGAWDICPLTPVALIPKPYAGVTGTGASVLPQWGGRHLELTTPTTNKVYVLFHGQTFNAAPLGEYDTIYDGYNFLQPDVNDNRPPELAVIRVPESQKFDIFQQQQAGFTVANKIYTTNSAVVHYNLGVVPINNSSVIAWQAGNLLTVEQDFFVNYSTGSLVFVNPPNSNEQLVTWSFGGTGAGITTRSVKIDNPGSGYFSGNIIYLQDVDTGIDCRLTVTAVAAQNTQIQNSGNNYVVGDLIFHDVSTPFPATWQVTNTTVQGNVLEVEFVTPGYYTSIPATTWTTNGIGVNATISTSNIWGVANVSIYNPGIWLVKPSLPVKDTDREDTPHVGNLASFNVNYDVRQYHGISIADGISNSFATSVTIGSASWVRATVDGNTYDTANIAVSGTNVVLTPTPATGAQVVVDVFQTPYWSNPNQQTIPITASTSYALNTPPGASKSPYASVQVFNLTSNRLMPAPPRQVITIANTAIQTYALTIPYVAPVFLDYFAVYQQQRQLEPESNYEIDFGSNIITLKSTLHINDVIEIVYVNDSYGYDWKIQGSDLVILNNPALPWSTTGQGNSAGFINTADNLRVLTWTQDPSYNWQLEQFTSAGNTYHLAQTPLNIESLQVYHAGQLAVTGNDFVISGNTVVFSTTPGNPVAVYYAQGLQDQTESTTRVLVNNGVEITKILASSTTVLQTVYATSDYLDIADYTVLTMPQGPQPGYVWIQDELIAWWQIDYTPTITYPNRAILRNIWRNYRATSGLPRQTYQSAFANGNGVANTFALSNGTNRLSVWNNGNIQAQGQDYTVVGSNVVFNVAPVLGSFNVRFTTLLQDAIATQISHAQGTAIYDGRGQQESL